MKPSEELEEKEVKEIEESMQIAEKQPLDQSLKRKRDNDEENENEEESSKKRTRHRLPNIPAIKEEIKTIFKEIKEIEEKLEKESQRAPLSEEERKKMTFNGFKELIAPLDQWFDFLRDESDPSRVFQDVKDICLLLIAATKVWPNGDKIKDDPEFEDSVKILRMYKRLFKLTLRMSESEQAPLLQMSTKIYEALAPKFIHLNKKCTAYLMEVMQFTLKNVKSMQANHHSAEALLRNEEYKKSLECLTDSLMVMHKSINLWVLTLIFQKRRVNSEPLPLSMNVEELLKIFTEWRQLLRGLKEPSRGWSRQRLEEILKSLKRFMELFVELTQDQEFRQKNREIFKEFFKRVYGRSFQNDWKYLLDYYIKNYNDDIHKEYEQAFKIAKTLSKFYNFKTLTFFYNILVAEVQSGELEEELKNKKIQNLIELQRLICLIDCSQANYNRSNEHFEEALQHHHNWLGNIFILYNLISGDLHFKVESGRDSFSDHGKENRQALLNLPQHLASHPVEKRTSSDQERPPVDEQKFDRTEVLECLIPLIHCLSRLNKREDENIEAWMRVMEDCLLSDLEKEYETSHSKEGKSHTTPPQALMMEDALSSRFNYLDHIFMEIREQPTSLTDQELEGFTQIHLKRATTQFQALELFDKKIEEIKNKLEAMDGRVFSLAGSGSYFKYHFYRGLYSFYNKQYYDAMEYFEQAWKDADATVKIVKSTSKPEKSRALYMLMGKFGQAMVCIYNNLYPHDNESCIQEKQKFDDELARLFKCCKKCLAEYWQNFAFDSEVPKVMVITVLQKEMEHLYKTFRIEGNNPEVRVVTVVNSLPAFKSFNACINFPEESLDDPSKETAVTSDRDYNEEHLETRKRKKFS